ncbi:hypothetical protein F2Q69_00041099 [Brassica cretica]|uniref:Uncharacterized protein n=1 Tax=Brassica cretica TaxID=69181 RepID=A0A8S9NFC2_BRACR|nr:hypothetical protein F2Q69_00041099 [Brassica cretica]
MLTINPKSRLRQHDPHHNTVSRLQRKLNHHRSHQSLPADDRGQQRKSKPETETKRGEHEKTGEAKSKRG